MLLVKVEQFQYFARRNCARLDYISRPVNHFLVSVSESNDLATDRYELARILNSSWQASKNTSSVVFVATAWGQATNVKEGGEGVCVDQTLRGGLVHHQRAKLWVCNVQNHFLSAVTWRSDADPPTGLL